MDFNSGHGSAGPSNPFSSPFMPSGPSSSRPTNQNPHNPSAPHGQNPLPQPQPHALSSPSFEIFEWYPHFQSCLSYFLNISQHTDAVQALAAFLNIALPFQRQPFPVTSSSASSSPHSSAPGSVSGGPSLSHHQMPMPMPNMRPGFSRGGSGNMSRADGGASPFVSLTPYIRRLIATGFDTQPVLHGFFGDSWSAGIGPMHEIERRNYLFAAKSANWLRVKQVYDIGAGMGDGSGGFTGAGGQAVPFLSPLRRVTEAEVVQAEEGWSDWLAMQDWMLGERGLDVDGEPGQAQRGGGSSGDSRRRERGDDGSGPFRSGSRRDGRGGNGGGYSRMDMDMGPSGSDGTRIKTEPR